MFSTYILTVSRAFLLPMRFAVVARWVVVAASISLGTAALAIDTTWTLNGNGNWNVPGNWSNGVPNNNTFNAFIDDGDSSVTVNMNINTTISTLTVGPNDTVSFADTFDLSIAGGSVVNNGIIALNAAGVINQNTDINFTAAVTTLTGSGTLSLGGAFENRVTNSSITNELVNSATHTIAGGGQLGFNGMKLTNQGLVNANLSGKTLFVDPSTSNAVNTGTMQASNGGALRLQGGVFTNTGALIQALDGSAVELFGGGGASGTHLNGGTLTSQGTGVLRSVGGDGGVLLENVTLSSGSLFQFGTNLDATLRGTITNNGTFEQSSSGTASGQIFLDGNVQLAGTGVWTMNNHANNNIRGTANGFTLTNGAGHTMQGSGDIGNFSSNLVNNGTIIANQATPLVISSPNLGTVVNNGTLRATGGATLNVNLGVIATIDNQGTIEALNGSSVTYGTSTGAANNVAGVLTGGKWRAVSTGGGATMTLRGNNITQIAANTEVELSGTGSVIQVVATPLEGTLATNAGTLRILGNRDYTAVPPAAFTNSGVLQLGGGTLTATQLNNSGEFFGFGTLTPRPTNSGTIRAAGGTLNVPLGIQGGSGTVQVDSGATLNLSAAVLGSSADTLVHNGTSLNLGVNNFTVGVDYQNGNFGVGNTFNARANVAGTGQINASPGVTQTLGGSVTNEGTATATMAFGNVHVGDSPTLNYQINNAGASGPNLRGAIQTTVGGANLTDARLGGAGVTASNFGPIAAGANSGNRAVTFNATSAGALTNQKVRIVNNFDNVAEQTLEITGAAYRYASPSAHTPEPVNFGIVHVGDVLSQPLSISNAAANDGFSERLNASIGSPTGSATTNGGTITGLNPGSSNNTNLVVGLSTATAGMKSGTATISLVSSGTGTSGLADTNLPAQTVNITAQVNNFAVANVVKVTGSGNLIPSGPNQFTLDLGFVGVGATDLQTELAVVNTAAGPADTLAGSFGLAAPDFTLSGFDAFGNVAAGSDHDGLLIGLDSATVGDFTGTITLQPRSTNPRPFSMNLAPITINLIGEVRLTGDFNDDGSVDAADYTVWRNRLNTAGPLANETESIGTVDQLDYAAWKSNFGATAAGGGSSSVSNGAVPEAGTLGLLVALAVTCAGIPRRRSG